MDQALKILSDPVGAGNAQVLRLTFDLVIRKEPQSFATQLQLLEQLEVVGYRLPAQLLLERAVLLYQVGRATEGEREFSRLRALWKKSEQYVRSEEHTSELQSLMRISYAVFCLKKKKQPN